MARGERALAEPVAAALLALAWIAGMFAAAGTLRWGAGWICLGVVGLGLAAHRAFVTRRRPEPWGRRSRTGPGTKPWDVIWLALWALGSPLLLRSVAAFVPALLTGAWLVLRTALEDRVLRREPAGYDDYARRVRWRWLPGVW